MFSHDKKNCKAIEKKDNDFSTNFQRAPKISIPQFICLQEKLKLKYHILTDLH